MSILCNDPFGGVSASPFPIKVPSSPYPQPSASISSHSPISHSSCSHPCPKLPSCHSPTTTVGTNCTMWTGCTLLVLEKKWWKVRLPSPSSSPQSLREVISSSRSVGSSPPPVSCLWCSEYPQGGCREQGPGVLSDRSHARPVKCWSVLGAKGEKGPF